MGLVHDHCLSFYITEIYAMHSPGGYASLCHALKFFYISLTKHE